MGTDFLDFKVVGDPKTQVGDEKESDNVPAMLFGPTLLRNPLVFEVGNKQQLNGHLNQFRQSVCHNQFT